MRAIVAVVVLAATVGLAGAEGTTIFLPPDNALAKLAPGPGSELAQTQCQFCHSTDYVVLQPRGDAKQWQGVVTKMVNVFGAPISEADAKAIAEYLTTAYGPPK